MKRTSTHISVVLDRTGSMEPIRDDVIGGFNALIEDQQRLEGTASLTLVQFDSEDPYEVIHHFALLEEVPRLTRETYVPRAATPLLDAIGRCIIDLDLGLSRMAPEERPENVVVVIITDGRENSSKEFRRDGIVKMVNDRQERSGWQFVFLSADLDAIEDAKSYGMQEAAIIAYDRTAQGVMGVMRSSSDRISELRKGTAKKIAFNRDDRDRQESEKRRGGRERAEPKAPGPDS